MNSGLSPQSQRSVDIQANLEAERRFPETTRSHGFVFVERTAAIVI